MHTLTCMYTVSGSTVSGECFSRDCVREGCCGPGSCAPSAMCSVRVQLFLTNDAIIYTPQSYPRLKPLIVTRRTAATMPAASANDSTATEHTEEAQLAELLNQEAGLTSNIELKVIRNELISYGGKDRRDGKEWTSQKTQVILQSKIAEQYRLGVAKLQKQDKAELKKVQDRFQIDTTWKFKTIKLFNEKPTFVHTSVRITIDLRKSNVQAMLQSTSFPPAPCANVHHHRHIAT